MDKDFIKRLNEQGARRLHEATRKLLEDDDVEAAQKQLTWVETSTKLLSSTQHTTLRKWSVIIVFVCLVIVGVAWTLRIPSTHVSLDVTTENVVLKLREDWSSNHQFVADEIFIDNVIVNSQKESASLHLQGEEIVVNELHIQAEGEIELSVQDHELQVFVKGAPLSGELNVQKAEVNIETEDDIEENTIDSEIPETITFKTAKLGAVPVQLRISIRENWRLRGLQTQTIGFVEEYPPGSGNFESVIRSGKITILETGREEELYEADYITLKEAKSRRVELSKAEEDKGVKVVFEGSAAEILSGPKDFRNNLTPTYFEYIYHQQKLKVFWGAVVFLFGVLWRIRNTIFSSK